MVDHAMRNLPQMQYFELVMSRLKLALVILGLLVLAGIGAKSVRTMARANNPLQIGQCTWYAFERAHQFGWKIQFDHPYGRHARAWPDRVTNAELVQTPEVGSLMVLDAWEGNPYGHVAFVEQVADKDHWTVTHANMGVGQELLKIDGASIREAKVSRRGELVGFEDGVPTLKLIGFLKRR